MASPKSTTPVADDWSPTLLPACSCLNEQYNPEQYWGNGEVITFTFRKSLSFLGLFYPIFHSKLSFFRKL